MTTTKVPGVLPKKVNSDSPDSASAHPTTSNVVCDFAAQDLSGAAVQMKAVVPENPDLRNHSGRKLSDVPGSRTRTRSGTPVENRHGMLQRHKREIVAKKQVRV